MKMIHFPSFLARARGTGAVDRHVQYAAMPFVETAEGMFVCLITSRGTGRWVLPKGWPKQRFAPHELARLEAYEEAGLKGEIGETPLGSYEYAKRQHVFFWMLCLVDVYPLKVEAQMLDWPEQPWQ